MQFAQPKGQDWHSELTPSSKYFAGQLQVIDGSLDDARPVLPKHVRHAVLFVQDVQAGMIQ